MAAASSVPVPPSRDSITRSPAAPVTRWARSPRGWLPIASSAAIPARISLPARRGVSPAAERLGLRQHLAPARAAHGRRDPPFPPAHGLDVLGPAQIDRRLEILRQQGCDPLRAADTAAGALLEFALRTREHLGCGEQVDERAGDRLGAEEDAGIDRSEE